MERCEITSGGLSGWAIDGKLMLLFGVVFLSCFFALFLNRFYDGCWIVLRCHFEACLELKSIKQPICDCLMFVDVPCVLEMFLCFEGAMLVLF